MSARLILLEQHISLIDEKINRMIDLQARVDLKNSEFETKIMGDIQLTNKYYPLNI